MGSELSLNLNDYYNGFQKFNSYINNIHNQDNSNQIHEGYLVNYREFVEIKNLINQYYHEQNANSKIKEKQVNTFAKENIIGSKKLKTHSLESVKYQILKNQQFIILNKEMYYLLCLQNESEKEKNKIFYKIDGACLILWVQNGSPIMFKNNKNNIIEQSSNAYKNNLNSVSSYRNYGNNWIIIYQDVKNYFENENYITEKLRMEGDFAFQGYLVNKNWVDKWKKYSYYDIIKENILLKNINDEYTIKTFIINEQVKSNLYYDESKIGIENYILKTENQILEAFSTNQFYFMLY